MIPPSSLPSPPQPRTFAAATRASALTPRLPAPPSSSPSPPDMMGHQLCPARPPRRPACGRSGGTPRCAAQRPRRPATVAASRHGAAAGARVTPCPLARRALLAVHIYDSLVTITHGDIYRNVIVNHLVKSYYNLIN